MIEPLDPKTEKKLRDIALGKAVPMVERDKFAAGQEITLWPAQLLAGLRSAYLLDRPETKKAPPAFTGGAPRLGDGPAYAGASDARPP